MNKVKVFVHLLISMVLVSSIANKKNKNICIIDVGD